MEGRSGRKSYRSPSAEKPERKEGTGSEEQEQEPRSSRSLAFPSSPPFLPSSCSGRSLSRSRVSRIPLQQAKRLLPSLLLCPAVSPLALSLSHPPDPRAREERRERREQEDENRGETEPLSSPSLTSGSICSQEPLQTQGAAAVPDSRPTVQRERRSGMAARAPSACAAVAAAANLLLCSHTITDRIRRS